MERTGVGAQVCGWAKQGSGPGGPRGEGAVTGEGPTPGQQDMPTSLPVSEKWAPAVSGPHMSHSARQGVITAR